MTTIKAISLWQPWATLIEARLKHYETRSWETSYRGPLAIHAARRWTKQERDYLARLKSVYTFIPDYAVPDEPPLGVVVCIVNLVDCIPSHRILGGISSLEAQVGDYSPGRFAWQLKYVMSLKEPIPATGHQGLWNWEVPESIVPLLEQAV